MDAVRRSLAEEGARTARQLIGATGYSRTGVYVALEALERERDPVWGLPHVERLSGRPAWWRLTSAGLAAAERVDVEGAEADAEVEVLLEVWRAEGRADVEEPEACPRCGRRDRWPSGACRPCALELRRRRARDRSPCPRCGRRDRHPSGTCRPCHRSGRLRRARDQAPCGACGTRDRDRAGACRPCHRRRRAARRRQAARRASVGEGA